MRFRIALLLVACLPLLGPGNAPRDGREEPGSRHLQLKLRGPASAARSGAPVELVSQRRVRGAPARERRPELSTNQLLLVVRGAGNAELARVTIPAPCAPSSPAPPASSGRRASCARTWSSRS